VKLRRKNEFGLSWTRKPQAIAGEKQMSDVCLEGLRHGRFKRKRGRECSDDGEGKAWTVVRPDLLKEWTRQ